MFSFIKSRHILLKSKYYSDSNNFLMHSKFFISYGDIDFVMLASYIRIKKGTKKPYNRLITKCDKKKRK